MYLCIDTYEIINKRTTRSKRFYTIVGMISPVDLESKMKYLADIFSKMKSFH